MKKPLSTALLVMLSAVLVAASVLYGARRGFATERAQVGALFNQAEGISTMLSYRANDAANLRKVSLRHLDASNEHIQSLSVIRAVISDEEAALHEIYKADAQLDITAPALAQALNDIPSFVQSVRDPNYVSAILRDMEQLSASGAAEEYNSAAHGFNSRLRGTVSGWLAGLTGIRPVQIFE